ncbi:hypothetical protein K503DRAFT_854841 [Rhizopogon vinicolor AM-OR11-026]|uniref:Uncharacterized protein n=1 Tax=Rhizopogon vinicolor AM-OR11-026 TaxID=1314800 RepID=A0A1B7N8I2_9AGAM|nr:hypothetical protein K503DRAFT_854841 [Rhizopogon vinicolor AM-OR11-026]
MGEENNLQKKRSIPQWWSNSRRGKSLLSVFNRHKSKVEPDVVDTGGGDAKSNSSVSEGNPGQDGDSGVRPLDLELVNQRFADASESLRNMERVPGSAQAWRDMAGIYRYLYNFHPYAKVTVTVFTAASKASQIFDLMSRDDELTQLEPVAEIYGKTIARQTLECADFIVHYSETKRSWKIMGKNIKDETKMTIAHYENAPTNSVHQFQNAALRDTSLCDLAEVLDFSDMLHANGAGLHTSKQSSKTPAVITPKWCDDSGGLEALFCFDRTKEDIFAMKEYSLQLHGIWRIVILCSGEHWRVWFVIAAS